MSTVSIEHLETGRERADEWRLRWSVGGRGSPDYEVDRESCQDKTNRTDHGLKSRRHPSATNESRDGNHSVVVVGQAVRHCCGYAGS